MRAAIAVCLLLAAACTSPSAQPSVNQPPVGSRLASGGVVEYAVPNPSPTGSTCAGCGTASLSGIAAGPDGNVWYLDFGQKLVGRVTPNGSITQFPVPGTGAGSEAITGGADGNIWMVARGEMNGPDWILKVSPAGIVTKYPLANGVGPEGITWGPDGNIWFTEFWTGRVGRMTRAGVISEFSLPTPNPRGIVTGPDHNLWIAEGGLQHESIARVTIKGEVTEYPLGSDVNHQLQPYNIVAGPDGNMWFTEIGHIGRITPAGVITQFPMGSGHDNVFGLAAGADGNVWFIDATANTVGRITPTGDIRQYPLPRRNAGPVAIAAGSDGRLWFTEANVSRVASIGYKVPEATLSSRALTFAGGSATTHDVTVTNTGDAPLVIAGIKLVGTDHAAFTVTHDGCAGQRVAVKGSCRIDVAFKPGSDSGVVAARLAITDNATASPQSVSLVAQLPDCKLPVFTSQTDSAAQGGFLSLRDGGVTLDPKGGFVPGGLLSHSQASPVLYGQVPATYDPAADRWVPGGRISPDGSRYAYIEFSSQGFDFHVHVVDVATGRDRTLNLPADNWGLRAFTTAGLYVSKSYPEVGNGPGLWLVNPDSGAIQTIFTDAVVQSVSGHMAWIVARNNADTLPGPPGIGGSNNEIQGRDMNTLQTTTWLYRPGSNMYVAGAAGGSLIVSGLDVMSSFLLVLTSPEQAVPINVAETSDPVPVSGGPIADANGWWLGSLDGVYLWTGRTGAVLVSQSLDVPAGACA
jgi:streptogramin lyase